MILNLILRVVSLNSCWLKKIKDTAAKTSSSKKLLEVLIDNKRTFNDYDITFNI